MTKLTLISFPACPYVQRAAISLRERQVPFDLLYIDLKDKPAWFLEISPLGKVPVLKVERPGHDPAYIFESNVILEYLEDTSPGPGLFPADPVERALHRAWIEASSQVLGDLFQLLTATDTDKLAATRAALHAKLVRVEAAVVGPLFAGVEFGNVDAAFASAFRQFDILDAVAQTGLTDGLPKLTAWRAALATRQSVRDAVPADYADHFLGMLRDRNSLLLQAPS